METAPTAVDRNALYEEVWTEPVTIVAQRYGLSDVGLAKICRSLFIPLPSRGYWAKVKAGKIMKRPALPALKKGAAHQTVARLTRCSPEVQAAKATLRAEAKRLSQGIRVLEPVEAIDIEHQLVRTAAKRLRQRGGWPAGKQLRHAPSEVLNLSVTHAALGRALDIANRLLHAFAKHGIRADINVKRSATVLTFESPEVTLDLAITEYVKRTRHEITAAEQRARDRYYESCRRSPGRTLPYPDIPQYDYVATGVLTVKVGSWPNRSWSDTPRTKLEERLGQVVAGTITLAHDVHARRIEAERKEQERRRACEKYESLVLQRADEAVRFKDLENEATNWERATRLRDYARAVEANAFAADGIITPNLRKWLEWTRAKADWLDPLVLVSDVILDAPEPQKPSLW